MKIIITTIITLLCISLNANESKIQALYNSLDQKSVSQHLAFYELYTDTPLGNKALNKAWALLTQQQNQQQHLPTLQIPTHTIQTLIALINKQPATPTTNFHDEDLSLIEKISSSLPNRRLKGYHAKTIEDLLLLPPEEIDLAKALLLTLYENQTEYIKHYEAALDLMALQIRAQLPKNASPNDKIQAINKLLFDKQHFHFPPDSQWTNHIDTYTFLPAVIDSRQGVCLGISTLYICLAQRLSLPLEVITPPGHIYVRYNDKNQTINIETTMRGVNIPSEYYLNVNTCSLEQRNNKEVIGLTFFNQAARYWNENDYPQAIKTYKIAQQYIPEDKLVTELLGYNMLFNGNTQEAINLLKQIENYTPEYSISKNNIAEDFLNHNIDINGLKILFSPYDDTDLQALTKRRQELQDVVKQWPKFRAGLMQLATVWLQLMRHKEALNVLEQHHNIDPSDPTCEYYLAILNMQRLNYPQAWEHLNNTLNITKKRHYYPPSLQQLNKQLTLLSPHSVTK